MGAFSHSHTTPRAMTRFQLRIRAHRIASALKWQLQAWLCMTLLSQCWAGTFNANRVCLMYGLGETGKDVGESF